MKVIIKIARNELRSLFYSPLAWFVLAGLYVMSIMSYFSTEQRFLSAYLRGGYALKDLEFLTSRLLTQLLSPKSMGETIVNYLFIVLPLITMGVFSREFRNGTDKLLLSAPVTTPQIVLGKYLGLNLFSFFIVGTVGIVLLYLGWNVDNADWWLIFANLTGFFLLIMLLSAVGMFISSLTAYQLVAGVITLVSFTLIFDLLVSIPGQLSAFGGMQYKIIYPYIADYLRIIDFENGKLADFTKGIINTRDIIYFLNLSAAFVAFTIIRLKGKRQNIPLLRKLGWYAAVIAGVAVTGIASTHPSLRSYRDITREKVHTLAAGTQQILQGMNKGPMHVTYYVNVMDDQSMGTFDVSSQFTLSKFWARYQQFKPDIRISYVYYYDIRGGEINMGERFPGMSERQIAEKFAQYRGVPFGKVKTPDEIKAIVDLHFEQYRNVALLEYDGKRTFLRNFPMSDNAFVPYLPEETEVSPALHRLIGNQPQISFSIENAECDPHSYGSRGIKRWVNNPVFKYAMVNQGLDSDTITLTKRAVPQKSKVLAICDPRLPLSDSFLKRFDEYLSEGKNIFITVEPDGREAAAPLLERLGLAMRPGVVGMDNPYNSGELCYGVLTYHARAFSHALSAYLEREPEYTGDSIRTQLKGAVALDVVRKTDFSASPFLLLDSIRSFNRPGAKIQAEMEGRLKQQPTDEVAAFPLGYKLTRQVNGREQRIVVVGDSDPSGRVFTELAPHMLGWLANDKFPVDLVKPVPLDKKLNIQLGVLRLRKWIWIYGVAGLFALMASLVLIRRARK